jgi:dihydroxyacetone kinase
LVIIGNYTGDRLNFGKAIEKAKIAGIKVILKIT